MAERMPAPGPLNRRRFLQASAASMGAAALEAGDQARDYPVVIDDFNRPDSLYHGDGWESLNPGYWQVRERALRRRLRNVGDRARDTGFPFHYETHQKKPMPVEYDPSLPFGMLWRRDWNLRGNYRIRIAATVRALPPAPGPNDQRTWRHFQGGYALFGICFAGRSLFESWNGQPKAAHVSWMAAWRDNGTFGIYSHSGDDPPRAHKDSEREALAPRAGDRVVIELHVEGQDEKTATVRARLLVGDRVVEIVCPRVNRTEHAEGYFGLVARGLVDFEVNSVRLFAGTNRALETPLNECHVCYPLGDTLRLEGGQWKCQFIALFRNDGKQAEVRVSDAAVPEGGWGRVQAAGTAAIVNNDFRRNTATINVTLPANPAVATLYYTIWKDGRDVTADPRPGFLGRKNYVGRLPRLAPPYKLCGLSCHAIHANSPDLPRAAAFEENWVHDQPTPNAYRHLEDYEFQVMLWEDDVWYLELLIFPPSTDDAYKIITTTLGGPTTRWQMMRHWNVINPGDHDHGMDDVKGPEQIVIRAHPDLGQDPAYMRRNYQIVSHLMSGDENPSPTDNPRRWRRWKMPAGDFSLLLLDSRMWRTSQDTNIWHDEGWGHKTNLYDRKDPTRTLLGEEQFAWLERVLRTDSARLICLSGINGLHTIWNGALEDPKTRQRFNQRDRVAADYAGWVAAGSDRVLGLLGMREGIVSVYGDVHNGCIMKNVQHAVYECSFGPIGRFFGRTPKPGFGPKMRDYDNRALEVVALYHQFFASAAMQPNKGPKYWNFLEMTFDTRPADPVLGLRIRNLIDGPKHEPRGGGFIDVPASTTGRPRSARLPALKLLANADVLISTLDGQPLRGARTLADGRLPITGLVDVPPGTPVLVTAVAGGRATAQVVATAKS